MELPRSMTLAACRCLSLFYISPKWALLPLSRVDPGSVFDSRCEFDPGSNFRLEMRTNACRLVGHVPYDRRNVPGYL